MYFEYQQFINVALSAAVTVAAGVAASVLADRFSKVKKLETEKLKEIRDTIYVKLEEQRAKSVDDISEKMPPGISADQLEGKIAQAIQDNLAIISKNAREGLDFVSELVNGYHQQALSQARIQFWFSVVAATVGFAYILLAATRASDGTLAIVLNSLPGVVIDAVAFLFFKQAEQTRERATALYDRLRQDSQVEGAREMVESIDDIQIRSLVKAQIALHMSGLSPKELDLQAGVLRRVG
ncbi:MAG: TRADD-N-associated membrane domain-containing protein [Methylobacter sp.]